MERAVQEKKTKQMVNGDKGAVWVAIRIPDGYISAPTQTLLQKWLREEHNVIVLVDVFLGKFICKVNNIIVTNNRTGDILKYDTYEKVYIYNTSNILSKKEQKITIIHR